MPVPSHDAAKSRAMVVRCKLAAIARTCSESRQSRSIATPRVSDRERGRARDGQHAIRSRRIAFFGVAIRVFCGFGRHHSLFRNGRPPRLLCGVSRALGARRSSQRLSQQSSRLRVRSHRSHRAWGTSHPNLSSTHLLSCAQRGHRECAVVSGGPGRSHRPRWILAAGPEADIGRAVFARTGHPHMRRRNARVWRATSGFIDAISGRPRRD